MERNKKIGTWTTEDELNAIRKGNRDADLDNNIGWVAKHKVHKSKKSYNRNNKHKGK